jgi:integrase
LPAAVAADRPNEEPEQRRQWLTEDEVEKIIKHAACERDQLMILVAYRHGLRVSELVHLRWSQVDLDTHRLRVNRLKNGEPSVHPSPVARSGACANCAANNRPDRATCSVTERGAPMTRNGLYKLLEKAAAKAGIADVHPHLLRRGTASSWSMTVSIR